MYWSKQENKEEEDVMGSKKLWIQMKVKVKSTQSCQTFEIHQLAAY